MGPQYQRSQWGLHPMKPILGAIAHGIGLHLMHGVGFHPIETDGAPAYSLGSGNNRSQNYETNKKTSRHPRSLSRNRGDLLFKLRHRPGLRARCQTRGRRDRGLSPLNNPAHVPFPVQTQGMIQGQGIQNQRRIHPYVNGPCNHPHCPLGVGAHHQRLARWSHPHHASDRRHHDPRPDHPGTTHPLRHKSPRKQSVNHLKRIENQMDTSGFRPHAPGVWNAKTP